MRTTSRNSHERDEDNADLLSQIFGFMKHMLEANNAMYEKMMSIVDKIVDKLY